jgi:molybdenum cofactor cytidylyltransferase
MTVDEPGDAGLPVVEPPFEGSDRSRTNSVAGVLLAAGTSSRFGTANKLLAEVDGEPLVRRAARTLGIADLHPLVAVVGHEADRVREALDGLGFAFVTNPDYAEGQATSVAAGVRSLDAVDAAVFALGDMPFVDADSVRALVAGYRSGHGTALAAAHGGRRGNPVLFDARHFPALSNVDGDVGGRGILLSAERGALVETGDPGVTRDVDVPDDL